MATYSRQIEQWAQIYKDTFVNESVNQDQNIDEAASWITYDAKYLEKVKALMKDLQSSNPEAYKSAIDFVQSRMGENAFFSAEDFARKRIANAKKMPATTTPRQTRDELMAQMAAKKKSEFDALQKAEFDRKNPHNIASIWVKEINLVPDNDGMSTADIEITYKDGHKEDVEFGIGTTGTAGGFENADRLYKELKRNMQLSRKPFDDVDVRISMIRVAFNDPLIKWSYGPDKVGDAKWAFKKEISAYQQKPEAKKASKEAASRYAVYRNGNTTIYRTESDDEKLDEASSYLSHVSQKQKDEALSLMINVAIEHLQNKMDSDEAMTAIARIIEDYNLDPTVF